MAPIPFSCVLKCDERDIPVRVDSHRPQEGLNRDIGGAYFILDIPSMTQQAAARTHDPSLTVDGRQFYRANPR
jgi:hypothetical protein